MRDDPVLLHVKIASLMQQRKNKRDLEDQIKQLEFDKLTSNLKIDVGLMHSARQEINLTIDMLRSQIKRMREEVTSWQDTTDTKKPTAKAPDYPKCNYLLRIANKPIPDLCKECGCGPCKTRFY